MKTTFLVTNYNYGSYLPRLFKSLQDVIPATQDGEVMTYELLIGDDCSSDGSQEIIADLAMQYAPLFERIEIVTNTQNQGKNSLLNQLISMVQTPYVVIIDADDWLHPDFLVKCWDAYNAHKDEDDVGFFYSNCILCDDDGAQVGFGKSTAFCRDLIKTHSYIPQTCLMKADALAACLPLDEGIRVGTKHHQWNKICDAGWRGVHIPESLFYYRMHMNNISSIGKKILGEQHDSVKDRLLYGYWPTARQDQTVGPIS